MWLLQNIMPKHKLPETLDFVATAVIKLGLTKSKVKHETGLVHITFYGGSTRLILRIFSAQFGYAGPGRQMSKTTTVDILDGEPYTLTMSLYRKFARSYMRIQHMQYGICKWANHKCNIVDFLQKSADVIEQQLPPSFQFKDQDFEAYPSSWKSPLGGITDVWQCSNQIAALYILAVVSLQNSVYVDLRGTAVAEPGARPWFLFDCRGHSGATFNIISDGEVFYPVTRITKSTRVVKLVRSTGKATVNLALVNQVDKRLINTAIEHWVEKYI